MKFETPEDKKYRDDLAGKLKEMRNSDEEHPEIGRAKAQGYLEATQGKLEYLKAREEHERSSGRATYGLTIERKKRKREAREHFDSWKFNVLDTGTFVGKPLREVLKSVKSELDSEHVLAGGEVSEMVFDNEEVREEIKGVFGNRKILLLPDTRYKSDFGTRIEALEIGDDGVVYKSSKGLDANLEENEGILVISK